MKEDHAPQLGLVVAMSRDGIIGRDNALPWHMPEDLKHFRRVTTGHAIIMGRKTHESLGPALPKRRTIVVSRQPQLRFEGCEVVDSLEAAIALAREEDEMPMVIGGASLYALALPHASHLFLTEIDSEVEGDTRFPPFDRADFNERDMRVGETKGVRFVTLIRRGREKASHEGQGE